MKPRSTVLQRRLGSILLSALFGAPIGGFLSYMLIAWFYAIGSSVISDETFESLSPSMFAYGAIAAILPSVLSGLLNPSHPILTVVLSQIAGATLAAVLAIVAFRWRLALTTYFLATLLIPIILSVIHRSLAASSR